MEFPTIKEKPKPIKEKSFCELVRSYYKELEKKQIFNQNEIIFYLIYRFHSTLTPYQVREFIKN